MRADYPTFTLPQTQRLIALNDRLTELEYWCIQRTRSMVEDYKRLARPPVSGCEGEDFELESVIEYYRPLTTQEESDAQASYDGLLLQTDFIGVLPLKWYFLSPTQDGVAPIYEDLHCNWNEGVERIEGLKDQRICWSFHDLHDHHGLTWDQILQIETIWVDIKAIHQRVTTVGKPFESSG